MKKHSSYTRQPVTIAVLLIFVAVILGIWMATSADTSLNGQKLVIGTNTDYPPFGYIDSSGRNVGLDYEYGKKLCEALEADCEWRFAPFEEVLERTASGEFDLAVASFTVTEYRKQFVDFSKPYYYSFGQFVRRGGTDNELTSGSVIAVQKDTIYDHYLNTSSALEDFDLLVFTYPSQEDAFRAVASGAAELTIADDVLTDLAVNQSSFMANGTLGSFERVGSPIKPRRGTPEFESLGSGAIGILVNKERGEVLKKVNRAVRKVKKDPELAAISNQYFGRNILK